MKPTEKGNCMKIVYIIDCLHCINGGTERQLHKLIEGMTSRGHEVQLFVLKTTDFTQNAVNFPCPIISLNISSLLSFASLKKLWSFRLLMLCNHVSVVHGFFNDVALFLPPLMVGTGIKTYTSRRDMGFWYTPASLWILRLFSITNTKLICNSHAVARFTQQMEWKPKESIKVIYNGLAPFDSTKNTSICSWATDKNKDSSVIKVVLVANIRPVKRIEDLIRAANHLRNNQTKIHYYIVGLLLDTAYFESLQTLLREYSLEDNFHFVGSVSEPRAGLGCFDIGVLTSESEGFSNSIMEYLDAGLPVVVSRVGGNPELVVNGHNGFLYQSGNDVSLAECLQKLANDSTLRKVFAANAKLSMFQFDNATMIERHEKEYRLKEQT